MQSTNPHDPDEVIQRLKTTVLQGELILKVAAGEPGERVRQLRAQLATAINRAKALSKRCQNKTLTVAKTTDQAVRDHPFAAIGIALGLGLLIGLLVASHREEED